MRSDFRSSGVPLRELIEWLGDGLHDDAEMQRIAARVEVIDPDGASRPIDNPDREMVRWDCFGYEPTFRAVFQAAAAAGDAHRNALMQPLAAASALHISLQCRAERIDEDRWVLIFPCIKHMREFE